MRIDCHNHTFFSPDSQMQPEDFVRKAASMGIKYLAVTEHMDLGYPNDNRPSGEILFDYRITEEYFRRYSALKEEYADRLELVIGVETGFIPELVQQTAAELKKYPFGYVINSVHICSGRDCYWKSYFSGLTKEEAYTEYLACVRESLDAPYRYDAVGHLGYISRPAPYDDRPLRYSDYARELDDILRTIIARERILEINSSIGKLAEFGGTSLPDRSIIERYYALGGRLINFASDAHRLEHINRDYERVTAMLLDIGFKEWTVMRENKMVQVSIR